jgi:hypothetical protein
MGSVVDILQMYDGQGVVVQVDKINDLVYKAAETDRLFDSRLCPEHLPVRGREDYREAWTLPQLRLQLRSNNADLLVAAHSTFARRQTHPPGATDLIVA